MIASTSSGRVFAGLGRYLARGRSGHDEARVAWSEVRHLPTTDPELAAKYMQAVARANTRVEKPVYHVALAFHPDDPVTPAIMRRAAHRLLADLGLEEHQAVIVAHRDREHPHLHLMVNRVHPETGKVWDRSFDYRRIEVSLRRQEVEFGVRIVPGRHAELPERGHGPGGAPTPPIAELSDPDRRGVGASQRERSRGPGDALVSDRASDLVAPRRGEVRQARRLDSVPLIERARARLPEIRTARTWEEVTEALRSAGLALERRGQGLVVTDGRSAVQASRVARDCAMRALEGRIGERLDEWAARQRGALARSAHRVPEADEGGTKGKASPPGDIREPAVGTFTPSSRRSAEAQMGTSMGTEIDPLTAAKTPATFDPRLAESVQSVGVGNAGRGVDTADGAAREAERRRLTLEELSRVERVLPHVGRALDDSHRANPELVRPLDEQPARVQFAASRLERYESVLAAGMAAAEARDLYGRARGAVGDAREAATLASGSERTFREALAPVYRDPTSARAELERVVAQVGAERAIGMMRAAPEMYGALSTVPVVERKLFSSVTREDDRAAKEAAGYAADLGERALAARAAAPTVSELRALVGAMDRAEAAAVRAEAALARHEPGDALARSVARSVARLDDREYAALRATIPVQRAEVADAFRDATIQVLARESAGRVQHLRERLAERGFGSPGTAVGTPGQQDRAATIHREATRMLLDGRELETALGGASSGSALQAKSSERTSARGPDGMAATGAPQAGVRGTGIGTSDVRGGGGQGSGAFPRERGLAADMAARAVHQAVQALAPDELQALVAAVRVGAQLAGGLGKGVGGLVVKDLASVQRAVRTGVSAALAGREVER